MGLIGRVSKQWWLERKLAKAEQRCAALTESSTATECQEAIEEREKLKIVLADLKFRASYDFDEG